jgi:hypothetical protein
MRQFLKYLGGAALALSVFLISPRSRASEVATADDISVQARGPIHEAFAQPADMPLKAGPIVPKQPPDPIAEEPPDQKPEGDNVQWIPGYWGWDDDSQNFMWVSGTWRAAPPDRKWVPGYWNKVDDGWQWVSGFWASSSLDNVAYVDEPPASLEDGPSTPAPDENSQYIPGSWVYRSPSFVWRPGYWTAARPGYIWSPAHYCYTPGGYVYVDGYWDYPLEDRGLCFAPVVFAQPYWTDPSWVYRPRYCISPLGLLASLFVRPGCGYYFGDYYGPAYARLGFSPWLTYGPRHWDPLFGYYRWSHRGDPGWYAGLRATHLGRLNGTVPLPARTLARQNVLLARASSNVAIRNNINALTVVKPLGQINNVHLTRLSQTQVAGFRASARNIHSLSASRHGLERAGHSLVGRSAPLSFTGVTTTRPSSAFRSGPSRAQPPNHGARTYPAYGASVPRQRTTLSPSRPSVSVHNPARPQTKPAYGASAPHQRTTVSPSRPSGSAHNPARSQTKVAPSRIHTAPRAQPQSSHRSPAPGHAAPRSSDRAPARAYSAPRAQASRPAQHQTHAAAPAHRQAHVSQPHRSAPARAPAVSRPRPASHPAPAAHPSNGGHASSGGHSGSGGHKR